MHRDTLMLRSELASQDAHLRSLEAAVQTATMTVRMLRSPAVQVVSLGNAESPRIAGRIFWDRPGREWRFYAAGLKPPGPGRTYELWFITADQKKIPAGTFNVNEAGEGELVVQVPEGVGALALAAVTDEPEGGVPQPTGKIHLAGTLPS
jgi:anti-sigma-K factor RskA